METELKRIEKIDFQKNIEESTTYLTHNFHTYPAKFIPQIVSRLAEKYTEKGELIVDDRKYTLLPNDIYFFHKCGRLTDFIMF